MSKMPTELYHYRTTVEKVVDGDTLDLRIDLGFKIDIRERVRLYGVNTPETNSKNPKERVAGQAAKSFVMQWLLGHHELTVQTFKDKRGKYGRVLAVIVPVGGKTSLNDDLTATGHAKPYFGGKR